MSKLSIDAKRLVENNIHLIEDSKFDELFNSLSYDERLTMAEILLASEIHFEGNTINKFKYQNIADFLNDLRIDKANISAYVKVPFLQQFTKLKKINMLYVFQSK